MCKKHTELHLHTCHSLKDAVSIPEDLAKRAKDLDYTSLGISEMVVFLLYMNTFKLVINMA